MKEFYQWENIHRKFLNLRGKIAEIMQTKAHLNPKGLDQILLIKSGMNRARSS